MCEDSYLDASFEDRTHIEEPPDFDCEPVNFEPEPEPYDGGGWPGDGSGTDDLADIMATGDEGCCDGPEDF